MFGKFQFSVLQVMVGFCSQYLKKASVCVSGMRFFILVALSFSLVGGGGGRGVGGVGEK
jgi:hypothetical protein